MRKGCASVSTRSRGRSVSFVPYIFPSFLFGQDKWTQERRFLSDWSHPDAFIRDKLSKGRYDPFISKICFDMLLELFSRTLKSDLGPRAGTESEVGNVC